MRRVLTVAASIFFPVVGAVWFLLDIVGTAATVMDMFDWVPMWVRKLAAHEELAYRVGPWFLMGLGVASLLAVHLWPVRAGKRKPKSSGDLGPNPQALRIDHEVTKAEEALKRAYDAATDKLRAEAAFAHGFHPKSAAARNAAVLALAQLRSEGVQIRNQAGIVTDATFTAWMAKVDKWMRNVIEAIAYVDAADAEMFSTLDVVPIARVNFLLKIVDEAYIPVFIKALNEHDLRLARLFDLLQKYQRVVVVPF